MPISSMYFAVFQAVDGQWYWTLCGERDAIIARGGASPTKEAAKDAIALVRLASAATPIRCWK